MSGTVSFTSARSAFTDSRTIGTCKDSEFVRVASEHAQSRSVPVSAREFTDKDGSRTLVAPGEYGGFYVFTPNVVA